MRDDWSRKDREKLRTMWGRGDTIKEIAATLDRTRQAVEKQRIALRLPRRIEKWPEEDKETLRTLWAEGLDYPEIAERLKRPVERVKSMRYEMGLPARKPRWSPDLIARFERMWEDGVQMKSIARSLDKSIASVRSFREQHKDRYPSRKNKGALAKVVHVRFTAESFEKVSIQALVRKQTVAAYIRTLLAREVGNGNGR
jgi:hypothetical protein